MLIEKGKKIKVIAGSFNLKDGPYDVFDENIVKLLNKISKEIFGQRGDPFKINGSMN